MARRQPDRLLPTIRKTRGTRHGGLFRAVPPDVACRRHEYNAGQGNANIILFHDEVWPYQGTSNTLALTTLTFNTDTGEIYDADMEINAVASEVDITIMVVQHRRFPRVMLQRVKQAVLNVGGRLIGVVLNNVDAKHDEGYSYYNSYNEYYGVRREAPKLEAPAPQLARPKPASREDY